MFRVRDATLDDAAVIAEILNESIAAGDATLHERPRTAAAIRRQIESFDERECFLIGEWNDRVVGWGIIKRYSAKRGYRFCCETSVFLRRDEIRKGYGSRLKRALIERCRAFGYHHLLARIMAENTASIEYNRSVGYELVGIQREIGFRDGRWLDVAVMQLVLDDTDATAAGASSE